MPGNKPDVDITGRTFGQITVMAKARIGWECVCECGRQRIYRGCELLSGDVKSCGHTRRDQGKRFGAGKKTHGMTRTSTYAIWSSMNERCHNPKRKDYPRYGGAGVVVCERWRTSFDSFLADMGVRPDGLTIDRVDGAKGYSPDNCRWATPHEQARNSSSVRWVEANGRTQTVGDWLRETGIHYTSYMKRKRRGWSDLGALLTPAGGPKC